MNYSLEGKLDNFLPGMTREEVHSIMNRELQYEDWMNGNLNLTDSLYYSDIVFVFGPCDGAGLRPHANLMQIWINCEASDFFLDNTLLSSKSYSEVKDILEAKGLEYKSNDREYELYIRSIGLDLAFSLDENMILDLIWIYLV